MIISIGCIKRSTRAFPMSSDGFPICWEVCPGWFGKQSPSCDLLHASVQSVHKTVGFPIIPLSLTTKQAGNIIRLYLKNRLL
jgi:hypothetical protein